MKPIIPFALLCALATSTAPGAVTDPVGYIKLGNPAEGAPSLPDQTDIIVSAPLVGATVFSGTVDSVAGQTLTLAGTPGLTPDALTESPTVIVAPDGLIGLVTGNTETTITVDDSVDVSGLAGAALSVREATTLSSFFAGNTLPDGLQVQLQSGTGDGINLSFDVVYTVFSGSWFDSGFGAADDAVLYPNEAFVIRNTTGTAIDNLVTSGAVDTNASFIQIFGNAVQQDTAFAYVSPVSETIAEAGIVGASGDQILVYDNTATGINKAASAIYTSFGGPEWFDSAFAEVQNTATLGEGKGFIYRRAAGEADLIVSDVPEFVEDLGN